MPTETRTRCRRCESRVEPHNVWTNLQGDDYCAPCYNVLYRICGDCGAEIARTDRYETLHGETLCQPCYETRCRTCAECDCSIDAAEVREGPGGVDLCRNCFSDYVAECCDCGRFVWRDDCSGSGDRLYCDGCASRGEWPDAGFYIENPTYTELRSERKFGVEIETSDCAEHTTIREDTVFGCKPDGSVDGMEFVSPVLYGDEGLAEVRKICGHARRLGWAIDSACGLHLHLDLSSESNENCFKVAHAYMHTYDFWTTFISNARKSNYYCAKHFYTAADLTGCTDFMEWCHSVIGGERYNWVNWYAYTRHRTVEIRHHSATLNPTKLCNWIKAHTRFIDAVVQRSKAEVIRDLAGCSVYDQFNVISGWWDDDDLTQFYRERARLFRKPIVREMLVSSS